MAATYRLYLVLYYLDGHKFVCASPQNMIAIAWTFEMACLLISVSFAAYRMLRREIWSSAVVQEWLVVPLSKTVL